MTQPCSAQNRCRARMKPWNERSGRIWAGNSSIGRIGLARGIWARGTVSAAARGIKAMGVFRHARPCAGHPRLEAQWKEKKDVDGRDKPGHDAFTGTNPADKRP